MPRTPSVARQKFLKFEITVACDRTVAALSTLRDETSAKPVLLSWVPAVGSIVQTAALMACTWLAATAGFVARVQLVHTPRSTAIRGRPIACGAEDPASVVGAQLQALQSGEAASLRACHAFMSPAYHERADALERFTEWFDSPVYESLLRCSSWAILVNPETSPSPSPQPHPHPHPHPTPNQVQLLEDPRRRDD